MQSQADASLRWANTIARTPARPYPCAVAGPNYAGADSAGANIYTTADADAYANTRAVAGSWDHVGANRAGCADPYTLFRWQVISYLARVPCSGRLFDVTLSRVANVMTEGDGKPGRVRCL